MEAQNEAMEGPGRSQLRRGGSNRAVGGSCRPVVADSHRFDEEERDPHQDLNQSEKSDPDPHQSEKRDPDPQHCFTWWVPQKTFVPFSSLF